MRIGLKSILIGALFLGSHACAQSETETVANSPVGEFTVSSITQPMGEVVSELVIREDGTGKMVNFLASYELTDIYIKDNYFEFDVVADTPWGDRLVTYQGTVEGDVVTGNRVSELGDSTFEGTRDKPE